MPDPIITVIIVDVVDADTDPAPNTVIRASDYIPDTDELTTA